MSHFSHSCILKNGHGLKPVFNIDHSQATEDKEPNQLGKKNNELSNA
jgi:hypothetical protein